MFSNIGDWRPSLNGLVFESLESQEVAWLDETFFEVEVCKALSRFTEDKTPRLDGFSITFWKFSWDFVKDEVMGFFREFHECGSLRRV